MAKKKWSTRKKVIVSGAGVVVAVGVIAGAMVLPGMLEYQRIISTMEIRTPDLTQISDGRYNGFFDANEISADVDVVVEDHRITEIVINDHYYGREQALTAEPIIMDVVDAQSLEVDTVSGATNSSLVILKAIETALESGVQ